MMRSMLPLLLVLALFAGVMAQSASRDSAYVTPKEGGPSGDDFQKAKVGLLDQYAKLKGVTWKKEKEEKSKGAYSITYSFKDAATLADFQKWQYDQPAFKDTLDKFSLKQKGTGASAPKASGRKLML